MNIGSVRVSGKLALAPLSGVTDLPFRTLCREYGAALVYSEFVSSDALIRGNQKSYDIINFLESERPIGIQIFGDKPDVLGESSRLITEQLRPDFIDINFGCPVKKVVKRNAGAACLKDLDLMQRIARSVVAGTHLPVTAKIRSGWDEHSIVAVEACKRLEQSGIQAVTVHPRTRSMFYSGHSDWSLITRCVESLTIPVIGNGDVKTPQDAKKMLDETGCKMVMIGRGALGKPYIFREMNHFLTTGKLLPPFSLAERLSILRRHIECAVNHQGEKFGIRELRKSIAYYLKGFPRISKYRPAIMVAATKKELFNLLEEFESNLP